MNQRVNEATKQWLNESRNLWINEESVNQETNQSANQRANEWLNQWIMNRRRFSESMNTGTDDSGKRWTHEPMIQRGQDSTTQWTTEVARPWLNESAMIQWINEPIAQMHGRTCESTNQWINDWVDEWVSELMKSRANQWITEAMNHSFSDPINGWGDAFHLRGLSKINKLPTTYMDRCNTNLRVYELASQAAFPHHEPTKKVKPF